MTLDEMVLFVVGQYDQINKAECCAFGLISNDGEHFFSQGAYVCHAPLRHRDRDVYDTLVTSFFVKSALDLRYFDFLKWMMYRDYSDNIHLSKTETGQYVLIVSSLSTIPASVLYNLCIASRFRIEYPDQLKVWGELVDQGVHPGFALAISHTNAGSSMDITVHQLGSTYHHWPFYLQDVNLELLVSGHPDDEWVSKPSYKARPLDCTPTNYLWGEGAKHLKPLVYKTIKDFWTNWKEQHEDIL